MKEIEICAYPYAVQFGKINIPNEVPKEEYKNYIINHWNDIKFGDPELDYENTDFEFYD